MKNNNATYKYLDTGAATRISIYGIFLGSSTSTQAGILDSLTNVTRPVGVPSHADFFRVPPQSPDSLNSTVKRIIDIILNSPTALSSPNLPIGMPAPEGKLQRFDLRGRKSLESEYGIDWIVK